MKRNLFPIFLTAVAGMICLRPTAAMPAVAEEVSGVFISHTVPAASDRTGTGFFPLTGAEFVAIDRTGWSVKRGADCGARFFRMSGAELAATDRSGSAGAAVGLSFADADFAAIPAERAHSEGTCSERVYAEPALSEPPQDAGQPSSDARATEILEGVAAAFCAMPSYGVDFRVEAAEYTARGNYAVEGERYYIGLGDAEVYSDGSLRYEVDNRRREVTLTDVDTASRNLFNNPVHAFDFLGAQYAATLLSEQEGRAVVLLAPTVADASPAGAITLTVDVGTMKPLSLAYDYDGERVGIEILSVAPLTTSLLRFDATNYPGYETIDFR